MTPVEDEWDGKEPRTERGSRGSRSVRGVASHPLKSATAPAHLHPVLRDGSYRKQQARRSRTTSARNSAESRARAWAKPCHAGPRRTRSIAVDRVLTADRMLFHAEMTSASRRSCAHIPLCGSALRLVRIVRGLGGAGAAARIAGAVNERRGRRGDQRLDGQLHMRRRHRLPGHRGAASRLRNSLN